jgi:hypothetical protein
MDFTVLRRTYNREIGRECEHNQRFAIENGKLNHLALVAPFTSS